MKVLFDLTNQCGWGDRGWITGHIAWYTKQGHEVFIMTGNWGQPNREDYNPLDPSRCGYRPEKPHGAKLYNPSREPLDYYINLITHSLGCHFWDRPSNVMTPGWKKIKDASDFDKTISGRNPHNFQGLKEVSQFEYKIPEVLIDEDYLAVQEELQKTKNIVMTTIWDEKNVYELWKDRRKGLFIHSEEYDEKDYGTVGMWDDILRVTKKIDDFCLKNPDHRIILFNKKAQSWENFLESDFYDLRYFEAKNLLISQAIHLLTENSSATISYPTSPQMWLNYSSKQNHIIYHPTYHYPGAETESNPEGILTGVIEHIRYFARNPADVGADEIVKLFSDPAD